MAWLPPTADGPPRKDLAQVVGNLKVRVKGVRKLRVETATMDPGQTAQDPNQLPNVPGELAALCLPACVCVYLLVCVSLPACVCEFTCLCV